jgi:O-methyltransferase involved in polyketide biosynthesis
MKENEASITAMMTAYIRAYHAMHDTTKIFDDSLAYNLIPEEKLVHRFLIDDIISYNNPTRNLFFLF